MGNEASVPRPGAQLRVIGAGLPRTGTTSFGQALSILLNGPVYHVGTQVTVGEEADIRSWISMCSLIPARTDTERAALADCLRNRLAGFVAVTDSPAAGFAPELLELFPDALVICSTRDPASWEKSMAGSMSTAAVALVSVLLAPLPGLRYFPQFVDGLRKQYIHLYGQKEPLGQDVYHKHIAWLKCTIPEDRLVFFDVKDGWEPLCKALGKEIPDMPFPKVNDAENGKIFVTKTICRSLLGWSVLLAAGVVASSAAWRVVKR
jgi:hypothetical protein